MDMFENFAVDIGEFESATTHDSGSDLHKSIYRDVGEAGFGAAILETGDKLTRETGAMEVDTDTDDGSGVEHTVDAGLGVVAHDKAAELQAGAQEAVSGIVPELDFGVVVLEVGSCCSAAEVAPFADNGVAEETVVSLVAVANHYHIIKFSTHLAVGAESGGSVNLGAHVHLAVSAGGKRGADT